MTAGLKVSFQKYFVCIQIVSLNESVWKLQMYQSQQNRAVLIIKISDVCANGAFWSFYLPKNHLKTWKLVSWAFIRVENCEILQLAFIMKIHFPWNFCICQHCKSVMLDNSIWQLFNNLPLSSLRFSSIILWWILTGRLLSVFSPSEPRERYILAVKLYLRLSLFLTTKREHSPWTKWTQWEQSSRAEKAIISC